MEVELGRLTPQARSFSFKYPGRYSVNTQLRLRHGPQGDQPKIKEFLLAGTAEISDDEGVRLQRHFERTFLDYEVGAELFQFDTDEVGPKGEKLFRIEMQVDSAFEEHYSEMTVYIRKQLKYPIFD